MGVWPVSSTEVRKYTVWTVRALSYFIYAYFVIVEIILGLGFVLRLFGANPTSSFVDWVYRNLDRAMSPFRGMFEPIELGVAGNDVPAVLDTSILFAMIVYAIVVLALRALIDWLTHRIYVLQQKAEYEAYQAEVAAAAAAGSATTRSSTVTVTEVIGPAGVTTTVAPPAEVSGDPQQPHPPQEI